MKEPKYPRITPLRAVALLQRCERAIGKEDLRIDVLFELRNALSDHVCAELTRRRRARRAKR